MDTPEPGDRAAMHVAVEAGWGPMFISEGEGKRQVQETRREDQRTGQVFQVAPSPDPFKTGHPHPLPDHSLTTHADLSCESPTPKVSLPTLSHLLYIK